MIHPMSQLVQSLSNVTEDSISIDFSDFQVLLPFHLEVKTHKWQPLQLLQ